MKRFLIALVAVAVIGLLGASIYMNRSKLGLQTSNQAAVTPVVFSDERMLLELWSTYKKNVLEPDTLRALDKGQGNITTSEGQSYTMLRAVWMDDKATFDQTWQWTKDNLQRDDSLMAWKFGQLPNGEYGIQTASGGNNTATDGDTDIAFALLMAASRWKEPAYLYDARPIMKSVWEKEVVVINGRPVVAANDIERLNTESIIVNPSYLSPYVYKVFAKADPARNWGAVSDNSYTILEASHKLALDKPTSSGLAPNWIRVNRTTGAVQAATDLDSNYGYDAFRTPWRLALDWQWNKDQRAKKLLASYSLLSEEWRTAKTINAIYSHDGQTVSDHQVPAAYGANLAYFMVEQPSQADDIYRTKLLPLYSPDTQSWRQPLSYYDDNWAWFGMALYHGKLTDLTENAYE